MRHNPARDNAVASAAFHSFRSGAPAGTALAAATLHRQTGATPTPARRNHRPVLDAAVTLAAVTTTVALAAALDAVAHLRHRTATRHR